MSQETGAQRFPYRQGKKYYSPSWKKRKNAAGRSIYILSGSNRG